MARVIDPRTGTDYTNCVWCGQSLEELRSINAQDLCIDCTEEA